MNGGNSLDGLGGMDRRSMRPLYHPDCEQGQTSWPTASM